MSQQASAMVFDQTQELRQQTSELESQIIHESMHDQLTQLPNRILLQDRLSQALPSARTRNHKLAILMVDINSFKDINEALGHYNGDRLLKQIATRLNNAVQQPNTVARLSGDEFCVLMPYVQSDRDVLELGRKLQKSLDADFSLEAESVRIGASIGIALYPEHGADPDTLLKRADIATHSSKKMNSEVTIFSDKLLKNTSRRMLLMGELRRAIDMDELMLHYQPKICMQTNDVISAEVLVRWEHPNYGLLLPDEFIPLAERTGLICQLTQWVIKNSLQQYSNWRDDRININLSINLSTNDILNIEFPDTIAGQLAAYDIKPENITLELTESAFMVDRERCQESLNRLHDMGIKLSIDDFGTGYSSLSYLSRLPVDEVKIDKSFVMSMQESRHDKVIVTATIDLAHNLNMRVVAEGVTDSASYMSLHEMGCDIAQGFHISKPMSKNQFTHWLLSLGKDNATHDAVFKYTSAYK